MSGWLSECRVLWSHSLAFLLLQTLTCVVVYCLPIDFTHWHFTFSHFSFTFLICTFSFSFPFLLLKHLSFEQQCYISACSCWSTEICLFQWLCCQDIYHHRQLLCLAILLISASCEHQPAITVCHTFCNRKVVLSFSITAARTTLWQASVRGKGCEPCQMARTHRHIAHCYIYANVTDNRWVTATLFPAFSETKWTVGKGALAVQ